MRGHRLTSPYWTCFARRVVANGENKIEGRCAGLGELAPRLRAKAGRIVAQPSQELDSVWVNLAIRLTTGAIGSKFPLPKLVQDRLSNDRACRIAGAEE